MIPEKRHRGPAMKPELAQKVANYAQQVCPECTALITTLITGAYPDYDVLVTLYNVPSDKIMGVRHTVRKLCRDIQKKHAVSIAIRAFDPEQTEKYHKQELEKKIPPIVAIPDKRLQGLEMKPQLAQKVVDYAHQLCPECTAVITTLVTNAYPDADALVTLFNVPKDKTRDVRHAVQRFCWDIQKKHAVIIAIRVYNTEESERYQKMKLKGNFTFL